MSIYQRASDGKWVGTLDLGRDAKGKRQRHVVYGKLRREVVAKLDQARSRLTADESVKDVRTTVASFVNDWLEKALPASGRRATTQALYSSLARTPSPQHRLARCRWIGCGRVTSKRCCWPSGMLVWPSGP
jgi:hypothetical protein